MKRYDIHATLSYDSQGPYAQWEEWEEEDGKWCLASEAQAEIDRLRGLVREAYIEGGLDERLNLGERPSMQSKWEDSDASKSLTPPAGKEQT